MEGSDVVFGLNLRGSAPSSFARIAEAFGDEVIYEIDAHCRQPPMVAAGAGSITCSTRTRSRWWCRS
jgi:hypothetical protein